MPPLPAYPRDLPAPALPANSVLGPGDRRTLEIAAEILRERTMSLDPDESQPFRRLAFTLIVATVVAAAAVLVFRNELRWLLGLA